MTKIFPVIFLVAISSRAMAAGKNVSKSPSKLCTDFGGSITVVKSETGNDVRLCSFERGMIGEETLLNGKKSKALMIFLNPPAVAPVSPQPGSPTGDLRHLPAAPNPSSRRCQQMGGRTVLVRESAGEFSVCEFSDHSIIEEWTLFRGRSDDLNKSLTTALEKRIKSR